MDAVPCPIIIIGRYPTIKHLLTVEGFHCFITNFLRLRLRLPFRRHRLYSLLHPLLRLLTLLPRRRTARLGLLVRTRARLFQRQRLLHGRRLLLHHHHAMAGPAVVPEPQAGPGLYGCCWGILPWMVIVVSAGVALAGIRSGEPGQRSESQRYRSYKKHYGS